MEVRSLENIDLEQLTRTFNWAFDDYYVPLRMNADQLEQKLKTDFYRPSLSAGAFLHDRLVGFLLHGVDDFRGRRTAYNCGTGVLPDHRGRGLTISMYDFIRPRLRAAGIECVLLEVIDRNTPALRSYEKCGFTESRRLDCYRGRVDIEKLSLPGFDTTIRNLTEEELVDARKFRDWEPAWQNADRSVSQNESNISYSGLFLDHNERTELAGYACHAVNNASVFQFAVAPKHRSKGIATAMFHHLASTQTGPQHRFGMINFDSSDTATAGFLKSIGLDLWLSQWEMVLEKI